jgi:hypothetical protein
LDDFIKKNRESRKRQPGNRIALKNKKLSQKLIQLRHEGGKPKAGTGYTRISSQGLNRNTNNGINLCRQLKGALL